jgi:ribose transport system permease protein
VLALSSGVLGVCFAPWPSDATPAWVLPAALAACIGCGCLCGLFNGLVTVAWGIPSFIVTLGMLEMARGGAYLVTGRETIYIGSRIGIIGDVLGGKLPVCLAAAAVVLGQFILARTAFGRRVFAVGGNEEAARLSGVRTGWVKVQVFVLSGALVGLAAIVHTARPESANPNAGVGFELEAIAAVVVGGTSLMGGRGSVVASFLGVLIIAVIGAGLNQMGAAEPTKRLVTGLVIVTAVVADVYRRRLARRRAA